MPKRPRPIHRAPNRGQHNRISSQKHLPRSQNRLRKQIGKLSTKVDREDSEEDEEEHSSVEFEEEEEDSEQGDNENMEFDEEDVDAPRLSQWVDEDELEEVGEETSSEDDEAEAAGPSQLKKVQSTLSDLPFGTLRKAQDIIQHTEVTTDSEYDTDSAIAAEEDTTNPRSSGKKERVEWTAKPRKDIAKRSTKHAPTEVTSKKPVSRLRQVIEVKKSESRDPRFLPVAGEFSAERFHANYSFLTTAHSNELSTLRDNLKRARKMLDNAPRHLKYEYESEVQRLELTIKRAESVVNKERMDKMQREALQKASKEEREKRSQGKGRWYMKNSEKRELVTRARYEALAAEGGKRAVKKAIEKRQKKISQKEKKSRPFAKDYTAGGGDTQNGARKRRRVG